MGSITARKQRHIHQMIVVRVADKNRADAPEHRRVLAEQAAELVVDRLAVGVYRPKGRRDRPDAWMCE